MAISDRDWVSRHVALASTPISRTDTEVLGRLAADTIAIATYARKHRVGGAARIKVLAQQRTALPF